MGTRFMIISLKWKCRDSLVEAERPSRRKTLDSLGSRLSILDLSQGIVK